MLKTLNNKKINLYAYFTKNQYTNDILLFQFSMSNISSNFISGVHLNKIKIIPEVETYEAVSLECDSDNCNLLAPSESKEVLLIIHGFAENLKRHKGPKPLDYLGSEFDMELEFEIYNLMKEKTTLVINVSTEKPKKHNNKEGELYKIEYSLSLNEFQEV